MMRINRQLWDEVDYLRDRIEHEIHERMVLEQKLAALCKALGAEIHYKRFEPGKYVARFPKD